MVAFIFICLSLFFLYIAWIWEHICCLGNWLSYFKNTHTPTPPKTPTPQHTSTHTHTSTHPHPNTPPHTPTPTHTHTPTHPHIHPHIHTPTHPTHTHTHTNTPPPILSRTQAPPHTHTPHPSPSSLTLVYRKGWIFSLPAKTPNSTIKCLQQIVGSFFPVILGKRVTTLPWGRARVSCQG